MAEDILELPIELKTKLDAVEAGVKDFKSKAESLETKTLSIEQKLVATEAGLVEVKAIKETVAELKTLKDSVLNVEKSFNEYRVSKDEADRKNQEWIDKQIARSKDIQLDDEKKKSFGDILKSKLEEYTDDITKMAVKDSGRKDRIVIDLKAVGDVTTGNLTGGSRSLQVLRPGIINGPTRKVHVRDLLPTGTIGAGTEFVFMRENGTGEGAIAPTAEGSMKPQIDLDLVESSVKIETIAGWLRMTRKAMNNIPGLISYLQTRLPERLLRVEDNLLLNGDGVSPNIKGIQVAGNFTAATGAATVDIEQIIQAMSQLEGTNEREATGIVLHPTDYYNLFLNKASGSGEYDMPDIVNVDPATGLVRILGVPVIPTTAQTVDKFLVGDFRMGAQLLIQEGIRIEFFEQDGTNVRENKITVRIEETVAFPVYGSDFFVFGDFGNVA